jgi:hypothetical protein
MLPSHKSLQNADRLHSACLHPIADRSFDKGASSFLLELAVAVTLCARIALAMAIRSLDLDGKDRSVSRFHHVHLVNDVDVFEIAKRMLRAGGVADEPGPESAVAGLLGSTSEHVIFAEARRAAVVFDAVT